MCLVLSEVEGIAGKTVLLNNLCAGATEYGLLACPSSWWRRRNILHSMYQIKIIIYCSRTRSCMLCFLISHQLRLECDAGAAHPSQYLIYSQHSPTTALEELTAAEKVVSIASTFAGNSDFQKFWANKDRGIQNFTYNLARCQSKTVSLSARGLAPSNSIWMHYALCQHINMLQSQYPAHLASFLLLVIEVCRAKSQCIGSTDQ